MSTDEITHKQEVIQALNRRKRERELQLAQFGVSADPAIKIEIEDLEAKIKRLEQEIEQLRRQVNAKPQRQPAPDLSGPINSSCSLRVFLCHSSSDKSTVRHLHQQLQNDGFDPWLDEENLLPGQDWEQEIRKAVHNADVVIVCLSRNSITKAGFVQKEIKFALDVADQQPEGTIFIIPLLLEECEVPGQLRRWQWVKLFEERGYERLVKALHRRANTLKTPTIQISMLTEQPKIIEPQALQPTTSDLRPVLTEPEPRLAPSSHLQERWWLTKRDVIVGMIVAGLTILILQVAKPVYLTILAITQNIGAIPTSTGKNLLDWLESEKNNVIVNIISSALVFVFIIVLRRFLSNGSFIINLLASWIIFGAAFWVIPFIFKVDIPLINTITMFFVVSLVVLVWNIYKWYILFWLNQASEYDISTLPSITGYPKIIKIIVIERNKHSKFKDFESLKRTTISISGRNISLFDLIYYDIKRNSHWLISSKLRKAIFGD